MNDRDQRSWSDERLQAAYASLVGDGAPPSLAGLIASRIDAGTGRTRRRALIRWPGPRLATAAVAAAVVVVAAGIATLGVPLDHAPRSTVPVTSSSPAQASPTSPSPGASALPTVLGLPVITVVEAIARRDAGPSPGEIAVRGWYAEPQVALRCAYPGESRPVLLPYCGEFLVQLMRDPEHLSADRMTPSGPSLNPLIREAGVAVGSPAPDPIDVIVVGHFDDPRSAACPSDVAARCRAQFVADRIVPAADPETVTLDHEWTSFPHEVTRPRPPGAVLDALTIPLGRSTPLSIGLVTIDRLAQVLPGAQDVAGLPSSGAVWIVRAVGSEDGTEPDRLRTLAIPDAWIADGLTRAIDLSAGNPVMVTWVTEQASPAVVGDAATALDLATRFETARATGRWAAAWALLSPQSRATIGSIKTFTTEEAAYNAAGGTVFSIQPPTRDPELLANALGASAPEIAAVADASRGYLVYVAHPDYPAASAGSTGLFIAPLRSGEWRVWIVH